MFISPTSRKLSWGHHAEDTIQLEDFMTKYEEDLRTVEPKRCFSLKKVHLTQGIHYVNLAAQQSLKSFPHGGEILNPAFVGDQ